MDAEIIIVLSILTITAALLIIDVLRPDIVAILCMLALAWTEVLSPLEAPSGFSSNAVITIISVMILGRGIALTGITERFSQWLLSIADTHPSNIVAVISAAAGLLSGFIQNIGSAALFLPTLLNISRSTKIAAFRLLSGCFPFSFPTWAPQ